MRWLVGSIDDWYRLFQQSYDHLAPGGWLESYEMSTMWQSDDGSVTENTALGQWGRIYEEGGRQSGRTFTVLDEELQRKAMEAAGFVDIQERNIKVRWVTLVLVSCPLCGTPEGLVINGMTLHSNRSGAGPGTRGSRRLASSPSSRWSRMPRAICSSSPTPLAGRGSRSLSILPSSNGRCSRACISRTTDRRWCGGESPSELE
jgi:hypothetical protein